MPNGLYFTKIACLGTNKPIAEVVFKKGLNVVSGASETGKSYIMDCMDYILGSRDQPKAIKQATGYEKVRAEIRTFDGKVITLERQFDDNSIYVADCPFENFTMFKTRKLSTWHSEMTDNNVSALLLQLIKLYGKKLKKNNLNQTKNLSFRDIARFCLVSETKIIEKDSPIYDGQVIDQTANKSLFKLLLTGEDDDDITAIENPEMVKSRIRGKIELINSEIVEKEKLLFDLKKQAGKLSTEDIEIEIQKLISVVEQAHKDLQVEEINRSTVWSALDSLSASLSQNEEVQKRFNLLNEHYSSDLQRLQFINEGKQGLDQIKEINCPLCNSLISQHILESYEETDDNFIDSVKNEFIKIQTKKHQLIETMQEIDLKIEKQKTDVSNKKSELDIIDQYIAEKLQPVYKINYQKLDELVKLKNDKATINFLETELMDLRNNLLYYNEKLAEKQDRAPETRMPEKIYQDLSIEVKKILDLWNIECERVYYDPTINDILIDGEKRSNSGKGYRAIYLSAFMVAVLLFCLKNNLKHPNFLVLDSPLTTYKERDTRTLPLDNSDRISEDIQNRFYETLASLQEINDVQIIVIENKDPPKSTQDKINYIHFSKNPSVGRYGFYPV